MGQVLITRRQLEVVREGARLLRRFYGRTGGEIQLRLTGSRDGEIVEALAAVGVLTLGVGFTDSPRTVTLTHVGERVVEHMASPDVIYIHQHPVFQHSHGTYILTSCPAECPGTMLDILAPMPHIPTATSPGHEGKLVLGTLGSQRLAILAGRFHYYEGCSMAQVS